MFSGRFLSLHFSLCLGRPGNSSVYRLPCWPPHEGMVNMTGCIMGHGYDVCIAACSHRNHFLSHFFVYSYFWVVAARGHRIHRIRHRCVVYILQWMLTGQSGQYSGGHKEMHLNPLFHNDVQLIWSMVLRLRGNIWQPFGSVKQMASQRLSKSFTERHAKQFKCSLCIHRERSRAYQGL